MNRTLLSCVVWLLALVIAAGNGAPAYAKGKSGSRGKSGQGGSAGGKKLSGKKGAPGKGKKGKGKKGGKSAGGSGGGSGGERSTASVVRPDVLAWLRTHNPGLGANFLKTDMPDRKITLPNGKSEPIYKLKQFLDVNFRLTFFARKQEKGSDVVPVMEERLRKLMALPDFYHWIKEHRPTYIISPKGKVSSSEAYNHFRHVNRHLGVTAGKQYKAPVGGGSGIAAPSWAVWKAMNIFEHEACHCIGIGHNSGGLSGTLAGALRKWDHQKKWNYKTIDLNNLGTAK